MPNLNFIIELDLHKQLKLKAAELNMPLKNLIIQALEKEIKYKTRTLKQIHKES